MNKRITYITCLIFLLASTGLMAQTIIWGGPDDPNSTFDGGLNDWTAVGDSCSINAQGMEVDSSNALWEYKADASPSGGAYAGTTPMQSASAANGAAIFNSDRLDNGGVQDSFLTGDCPAPHKGYLLSPVMDFSSESSVILSFHQYYRRFSTTRSLVEVSNDGTNWTVFEVNQEIASNQATPLDSKKTIDISAVAANQASVQIRFVFDGEYYFWLIDDVTVVNSLPQNSISMDRHFYPVSNTHTPEVVADGETYNFSALISNTGGNEVTDAYLKVEIIETTGGTTIWADSILLDPIPPGTSSRLDTFPADITYSPGELEPGSYTIRYTLFQPGIADFFPSDNIRQSAFVITPNSFWQSGVLRVYARPCFGDPGCTGTEAWSWGAFFFIPEETVEDFIFVDAEVAVAGEAGGADLNGKELNFFMIEILNDDFFGSGIAPGDEETNSFAAFGSTDISASNERVALKIPLLNLDDEDFIAEKGAFYMGYLSMPDRVRMGYDNLFNNYPFSLEDNLVRGGSSRLFFQGEFKSTFRDAMPYIKLGLSIITSVDNNPLPEQAVSVFPNPAGNYTMVDLKLEKASNITITLADISGKVINFQNFQAVQNMQHTIDTSTLPVGAYIVRVATEYGTSTKKLMIAK